MSARGGRPCALALAPTALLCLGLAGCAGGEGAGEPDAADPRPDAVATPDAPTGAPTIEPAGSPAGDGAGAPAPVAPHVANARADPWFAAGAARIAEPAPVEAARGAARNAILFVGDGMGASTVTAARIREGQLRGEPGEGNALAFDAFPYTALAKTYNVDAQVPDSAATMTALATGVKTDAGTLGIDEGVVRGDCASGRGRELVTALELAELGGLATGIVSTARLTHATPAALYAKAADRAWEDDSRMPTAATGAGCTDIASQLAGFAANLRARYPGAEVDGMEVAMGGGRRHFLPADAANGPRGRRADGRDLLAEWLAAHPDGTYVDDRAGFDALPEVATGPVLALLADSHLRYEADRVASDAPEPSLSEMVARALALLDDDPDGFLLVVESARIDHAHHAGSAHGALAETIELSRAVAVALEATGPDTLVVVTADHGHTLTLGGRPRRGNPILGLVVEPGAGAPATAADGLPYTTLGYRDGLGFRELGDDAFDPDLAYALGPAPGRRDLAGVDTASPGFHQEALVPLPAETHSGEDVPVHAIGPGASLVRGTIEQSAVFHVVERAADLVGRADAALAGR